MLALEQGEVDGAMLPLATVQANRPDLIRSKFILPIIQTDASLPGVPVLWDSISEKTRPLLNLALSSNRWGLPLIGPPGIPADRLAIIRTAFLKMTQNDEAFKKEGNRLKISVGKPIGGESLAALVREILESANKKVVEEFKALVEEK
jgi:hypothetical protein